MKELVIHPLEPGRWDDLVTLFGDHGAVGGCWCMYWRRTSKDFERSSNRQNRADFEELVMNQRTHGLLAYLGEKPVGWCSLDPREALPKLQSPYWRSIDEHPVWSIICFYIYPEFRQHKVATRLLEAAIDYARQNDVQILEAYPLITKPDSFDAGASYRGTVEMYQSMGFVEVLRRQKLVIMRLKL